MTETGEIITVVSNTFKVIRYPEIPFYHYHVVITQPGRGEPQQDFPARRAHQIIDEMQNAFPQYFTPRAFYDGKFNLFSQRNLSIMNFSVQMSRVPGRGLFNVRLERVLIVAPINPRQVRSQDTKEVDQAAINLLQIMIRQAPNKRHSFPPQAKAFFTETNAKALDSAYLMRVQGYFQSIRPSIDGLLVNVDVANAVTWVPGSLINLAMKILQIRDIRDLTALREGHRDWRRLNNALKNIQVKVSTSPLRRPSSIRKLETSAREYEFRKEGFGVTTVEAHFRDVHHQTVRYGDLFTVRIGREAVVPAEFCEVLPKQIYKKKLSPADQRDFMKFCIQNPRDRLHSIKEAVDGRNQQLDWQTSDVMLQAGMQIHTKPMEIQGRVLIPPLIEYGMGQRVDLARAGAWNVRGRQLYEPKPVECWAVISFEPKYTQMQLQDLAHKLYLNLTSLGTVFKSGNPNWDASRPNISEGHVSRVAESLRIGIKEGATNVPPPTFVLVVLPTNAGPIRRAVKLWGDIHNAFVTQCVRFGPKLSNPSDQYLNNVALKINAKIGGINSVIKSDAAGFLANAMVVGTDVGHPGPGVTNRPSITSLVASVNASATRYISRVKVQAPRTEMIEELRDMLWDAFKEYWLLRQTWPKHLVFYRDGVSEGEFDQVSRTEISQIRQVFDRLEKLNPKRREVNAAPFVEPTLVFIVVGKRHHIRFFPKDSRHADKSGNLPPGLAVDTEIKHPLYDDFYLLSHSGILGTSRPAHYTVLHNNSILTSYQLQMLSYHLCHVYASATRSVSIPAPIFYADRICARGDFHVEDQNLQFTEDALTANSDHADFNLGEWQSIFKSPANERQMYYL